MILNCEVGMFVNGLDSDVVFGLLDDGVYEEYTKENIPDKYLEMDACIRKLESGYLIAIKNQ